MGAEQVVRLVVGVIVLICSLFSVIDATLFVQKSVIDIGYITYIDHRLGHQLSSYHVAIKFTPKFGDQIKVQKKPIQFEKRNAYFLGDYKVRDHIFIRYLPNNPNNVRIAGFFSLWFFPLLFLVVGISASWPLVEKVFHSHKVAKKRHYLTTTGEVIFTNCCMIEVDTSIVVNGKNPYFIICWLQEAAVPNTFHLFSNTYLKPEPSIFISPYIWFNPQPYINKNITVYVDRANPKEYYVDISFLENIK